MLLFLLFACRLLFKIKCLFKWSLVVLLFSLNNVHG